MSTPKRTVRRALPGLTLALASLSPAPAQTTEVANVWDGSSGYQAYQCDLSSDGNLVAYWLAANGHIEVRDRSLQGVTTVSTSGSDPSLAGNGSAAAFSTFDALVGADTNFQLDVYVKNLVTGGTVLASAPFGAGGAANGQSITPRMSDSGDRVAFQSLATNLTADVLNTPFGSVFVRTLSTSSTVLASTSAAGVSANSPTYDPDLSGNGRHVAFWGAPDNLVPGDTNSNHDVFVKDLLTGAIALVSRSSSGQIGDGQSWQPSISESGRYVAFASQASNLGGASGFTGIYRHDRDPDGNGVFDEGNGVTVPASVNSLAQNVAEHCFTPRISDDGQRVLFLGQSLVEHELQSNPSGLVDVFVHDFASGELRNLNVDSAGNHGDGTCIADVSTYRLSLSGDGSAAAFVSFADNLDAAHPDGRGLPDVFVHEIGGFPAFDLGFDRKGSNGFYPEFSLVGGLATGQQALLRLRRAPPSSFALLLVGLSSNPTPGFGGTLVPLPFFLTVLLPTDANGSFTALRNGGHGPLDLYLQWLILDPGHPAPSFAISNAQQLRFLP